MENRTHSGVLIKMRTELDNPIRYYLKMGDEEILMNNLIGRQLSVKFTGYQCLGCGKERKIYRQGFCYNCFFESAEAGEWILHPELSTAHMDIEDRNLEYEKEVQLQPHIVYLALSSNVKVGVTRKTQIPTRWIDQGATEAIEILEAPNRYLAGITEVALKEVLSDKTNWRKMLKNEIDRKDLLQVKEEIKHLIPKEAGEYFLENHNKVTILNYPVLQYPDKVKSITLAKVPEFEHKLMGIKGQYLLFENNFVFNVRNNEGHKIILKIL